MDKEDEIAEKVLLKLGLCDEIGEFSYDAVEVKIVRETVKETAKEIFDKIQTLGDTGYGDIVIATAIKEDWEQLKKEYGIL